MIQSDAISHCIQVDTERQSTCQITQLLGPKMVKKVYIQNCICNKFPFFKPIKNLLRCKQSQFTCFYKSNINQTFTNSGGMIWGVRIAIFTEIRHLVENWSPFCLFFDLKFDS